MAAHSHFYSSLSHERLQAASRDEVPKEAKPVRVRAGFGVFQPSRVGRLNEDSQEPAVKPASSQGPSDAPTRPSSAGVAEA